MYSVLIFKTKLCCFNLRSPSLMLIKVQALKPVVMRVFRGISSTVIPHHDRSTLFSRQRTSCGHTLLACFGHLSLTYTLAVSTSKIWLPLPAKSRTNPSNVACEKIVYYHGNADIYHTKATVSGDSKGSCHAGRTQKFNAFKIAFSLAKLSRRSSCSCTEQSLCRNRMQKQPHPQQRQQQQQQRQQQQQQHHHHHHHHHHRHQQHGSSDHGLGRCHPKNNTCNDEEKSKRTVYLQWSETGSYSLRNEDFTNEDFTGLPVAGWSSQPAHVGQWPVGYSWSAGYDGRWSYIPLGKGQRSKCMSCQLLVNWLWLWSSCECSATQEIAGRSKPPKRLH